MEVMYGNVWKSLWKCTEVIKENSHSFPNIQIMNEKKLSSKHSIASRIDNLFLKTHLKKYVTLSVPDMIIVKSAARSYPIRKEIVS